MISLFRYWSNNNTQDSITATTSLTLPHMPDGNRTKGFNAYVLLLSMWKRIIDALTKVFDLSSKEFRKYAQTASDHAYDFCGVPCIMVSLLYSWRVVIFYLPIAFLLYTCYTTLTVFVEDYLLPWIRRCKLLSDFIKRLSPNLALRMLWTRL